MCREKEGLTPSKMYLLLIRNTAVERGREKRALQRDTPLSISHNSLFRTCKSLPSRVTLLFYVTWCSCLLFSQDKNQEMQKN